MTYLRDITDEIYEHEELVRNDCNQDRIADSRGELLENLTNFFWNYDGSLSTVAVQQAREFAPHLGVKVVHRKLSIYIPNELDVEDGVVFKRVTVARPT